LRAVYAAVNARDINTCLAFMHEAVELPNGMEGGYVHGHEEVRAYWTRQWRMIDPLVTPESFSPEPDGRTLVRVHQVVRDISGAVVSDQLIEHVYRVKDDLIEHTEIREC